MSELVVEEKYGVKHLIQCQCILPQYKNYKNPTFHKFVVFSEVNSDGSVNTKLVQCPNCGVLHKIVDLCVSEILQGKEQIRSVVTIDEIKLSLPEKIVSLLETYDLDLATWENVNYIVDNELWGSYVVLSTDVDSNIVQGKIVRILGTGLVKIESFVRSDEVRRG